MCAHACSQDTRTHPATPGLLVGIYISYAHHRQLLPSLCPPVQAKLQLRRFLDGALSKELELPGIGSIGGFSGSHKQSEMFFTFTGFTEPGATYRWVYEVPSICWHFKSVRRLCTAKGHRLLGRVACERCAAAWGWERPCRLDWDKGGWPRRASCQHGQMQA